MNTDHPILDWLAAGAVALVAIGIGSVFNEAKNPIDKRLEPLSDWHTHQHSVSQVFETSKPDECVPLGGANGYIVVDGKPIFDGVDFSSEKKTEVRNGKIARMYEWTHSEISAASEVGVTRKYNCQGEIKFFTDRWKVP